MSLKLGYFVGVFYFLNFWHRKYRTKQNEFKKCTVRITLKTWTEHKRWLFSTMILNIIQDHV